MATTAAGSGQASSACGTGRRYKNLSEDVERASASAVDGGLQSAESTVVTSSLAAAAAGSTITFHNVSYEVKLKKNKRKVVLDNVSGIFKPGMNAILGPTGSGKTSLLDVLAGRKHPAGLSGTVLVDGATQPANFRCCPAAAGYVVQEDTVLGALTVRENLAYCAALRLSPRRVSAGERRERVELIVRELGLAACADSKCGTDLIRGVSGGERKRVNIGMELLTRPRVLFLDEPTTGLDSSTAHSVICLLRRLAGGPLHGGPLQGSPSGSPLQGGPLQGDPLQGGPLQGSPLQGGPLQGGPLQGGPLQGGPLQGGQRTIIFSIHQPRYSIYRQFDDMYLLSDGRCVYHGPQANALTYFSALGYECEPHNNPPDFFMDVINGDVDSASECNPAEGVTTTADDDYEQDKQTAGDAPGNSLAVQYLRSPAWAAVHSHISPIFSDYQRRLHQLPDPAHSAAATTASYATSPARQFLVLSKRNIVNLIRNPATSIVQVIIMLIFSVIVGTIYWQLDLTDAGLQNRVGAFFFIVMNLVFGNLSAVELFLYERPIFIHQNGSGYYRTSSYFLAKVFCDILPMRAVPVLLFASITYWMLGFKPDVYHFLFYLLNMLLTSLSASAISFFASASVGVFALANLIVALIYVFMMVFSGLLVNIESILAGLRWLKYFSIFRYSMAALSINELSGLLFCTAVTSPAGPPTGYPSTPHAASYSGYPQEDGLLAGNMSYHELLLHGNQSDYDDITLHNMLNDSMLTVTTQPTLLDENTSIPAHIIQICTPGTQYLSQQGIAYGTEWDLWQNEVALAVMTVVFLLLAYIQLRTINKWK